MLSATELHQEALAWHQERRYPQAEQKYKEALLLAPNHPDILSDLAILYYHTMRYQEALDLINRAINIGLPKADYYFRLGLILEKTQAITPAIRAYQQATYLNQKLTDAYVILGRILWEQGNISKAETLLQQAINLDQNRADAHYLLGKVLIERRQVEPAISAFKIALNLQPSNQNILYDLGNLLQKSNRPEQYLGYFYLGNVCFSQKKYEEAITHYQSYLKFAQTAQTNFNQIIETYLNLMISLYELGQDTEAALVYRQVVHLYPNIEDFWVKIVDLLSVSGRVNEAIKIADQAPPSLQNQLGFTRKRVLTLPVIYENEAQIEFYRQRFTEGLEYIINNTKLENPQASKNALNDLGVYTNFYLGYQGKNDLDLQTRYGRFFQQVLAANYPKFNQHLPMPPISENGKIRVGYISNYFYSYHTVPHLFMGWLRHCDRQKFEVHCYQLGSPSDMEMAKLIEQYSDKVNNLRHTQALEDNFINNVCEKIIADRLHILVFLDIGMHPYMSIFGSLRLAPIQCTTWAHPITSGLPTIDYFLSSDLMEKPDADKYYSEQLVRLHGISISYPKPAIPAPTKTRLDFQLRSDAIVYLCCQSIYKYLPQYDYIWVEIARRIPQAQFAFISNKSTYVTKQFQHRLQRAFGKAGLKSEDYCVILPQQYQINYWNLNLISDIFLDSLQWSGGRTTLEAIACNLPIVTCPGEFMRSRHSYAILHQLGVTETIANNEAEYIEIAVKLGLDRQWRDTIIERMRQRHSYLYDDKNCVIALEAFYQQVVAKKLKN